MQINNYNKFISNFGGDPSFGLCTVDKLEVTHLNKVPIESVLNCPTDQQKGICIYGNPGTGKSHILKVKFNLLYLDKLGAINGRIADARYPQWISLPDYTESLKPNKPNSDNVRDGAKNATWLFIDELGVGNISEWNIDQTFQLLDHRLNNGLQTYISSNLTPDEIQGKYGERILSRIYGMCRLVKYIGPDRRKM